MNILLAEDEVTISRLIGHVLTQAGHLVTGTRTVAEAIGAFAAERFDLVLLDLSLADGDGFRVVETIEVHAGHRPPVVVITGERSFLDEDPRADRVAWVLTKPFDLEALEHTVQRFVA